MPVGGRLIHSSKIEARPVCGGVPGMRIGMYPDDDTVRGREPNGADRDGPSSLLADGTGLMVWR